MENKTLQLEKKNRDYYVKKHVIFEWTIIDEKKDGEKISITFQRDDSVPYYQDLVALENSYNQIPKVRFWPAILMVSISILLLTIFLVLLFALKDDFVFAVWFFSLCLPALALMVASVIVLFSNMKQIEKEIQDRPNKNQQYLDLVKKLKENK